MQQINITELRLHLPVYLDRVRRGEQLQVTVRGQVVARLIPEQNPADAARDRLIALRSQSRVGDVVSPLEVGWSNDTPESPNCPRTRALPMVIQPTV